MIFQAAAALYYLIPSDTILAQAPSPSSHLCPSPMASTTKTIAKELPNLIKLYTDGSVERLIGFSIVPPSPSPDPETGVSSKDITISQKPPISARFYLPKLSHTAQKKIPILIYFYGGAFCVSSAFAFYYHRYLNRIVSRSQILAVSVEYRRAPEHPLPAAYQDSWAALQWVAENPDSEPWLTNHGDFERIFVGGDSAGANIVHNITIRAGVERFHSDWRITGAFLSIPYFWGSEPIGSESGDDWEKQPEYLLWDLVWDLVYPSAAGGIDNPMVNPFVDGAPSLSGLGCSKLLVCVAGKDTLRERGVRYSEKVRESGWKGKVELYEMVDEVHGGHLHNPDTDNANNMIKCLANFFN